MLFIFIHFWIPWIKFAILTFIAHPVFLLSHAVRIEKLRWKNSQTRKKKLELTNNNKK